MSTNGFRSQVKNKTEKQHQQYRRWAKTGRLWRKTVCVKIPEASRWIVKHSVANINIGKTDIEWENILWLSMQSMVIQR